MAIPALNAEGELPPGEHRATIAEVKAVFGKVTAKRIELFTGLELACRNFRQAGVGRIWLNGSFITDKTDPNDIDGCWEWTAAVSLTLLDPVFLAPSRKPMKAKYGLDFFIAHFVEAGSGLPFPKFFQVNRNGQPKGILLIEVTS